MSDTKKAMPYLSVAVICETALQEKNELNSLIRIYDSVTIGTSEESLTAGTVPLTAFIAFKSGDAEGTYQMRLALIDPDGKEIDGTDHPMEFTGKSVGPHGGCNLIVGIRATVRKAGLHWIDVTLENERVTRIPIYVRHQKIDPPAAPPEQPGN